MTFVGGNDGDVSFSVIGSENAESFLKPQLEPRFGITGGSGTFVDSLAIDSDLLLGDSISLTIDTFEF